MDGFHDNHFPLTFEPVYAERNYMNYCDSTDVRGDFTFEGSALKQVRNENRISFYES